MQDFKINSQMPTAANPASGVSPAQEYQQQNKKPQRHEVSRQTPLQGSMPNTASGKKFKKPSRPAALGLPSIDPSMFRR